jgi:hypothetical protein
MTVLKPPTRTLPAGARPAAPPAQRPATGGESDIPNAIKISRPVDTSPDGTQIVETNNGILNILGQVMVMGGSTYAAKELGSWRSGNPKQARTVRVVTMPLRDSSYQQFETFQAPNLGAMVLIKEFGEQGAPLAHWVPVPCDMTFCAVRLQMYVLGVGLPYQALPQASPVALATLSANVQAFVSEHTSFLWPSVTLFPARTTITGNGPGLPAAGVCPLFPYNQSPNPAELGCAGFLRSVKVTNTTATGYLVNLFDAPVAGAAIGGLNPAGPTVYPYVQKIPFYAPAGTTVLETYDDVPFFWGPWVGINTTPGGAWATGAGNAGVLVEADYVALQPPVGF